MASMSAGGHPCMVDRATEPQTAGGTASIPSRAPRLRPLRSSIRSNSPWLAPVTTRSTQDRTPGGGCP